MTPHPRRISLLIASLVLWTAMPAVASLQTRVQKMVTAEPLGATRVAILVVDLNSGAELVALNADEPMIPASNMKLLTTATALDLLGPDFVFRTELRLLSSDNEQRGAVVLVRGDGDPAFGDRKMLQRYGLPQPDGQPTIREVEALLQAWVQAVRHAGVTRIDRLVIDDRVFDDQFVHPTWPRGQLNRWYCAQVAGLNFYDNCLDVYPTPASRVGLAPRISVFPEVADLEASNRAVTGTDDTFWISRAPGTNQLTYMGKVKHRARKAIPVTVHDPPMMFGRVFADRLRRGGVAVAAVGRPHPDDRVAGSQVLHVVQTPLTLVVERCNKDSQNLFAEALLKRVGLHLTGAPGSWRNGAAAVRLFLNRRLGPGSAVVSVADGSGLSRENRLTASILVSLLASMHRDDRLAHPFQNSLAVGGEDGSLKKRFDNLTGTVYGKSGYLDGVSSLSGYLVLPTETGDRVIAFALLFNGFKAPLYNRDIKAFQDKLLDLIDEHVAAELGEPLRIGG